MTQSIPAANGVEHSVICFNPTCRNPGTHYPVITFGTHSRLPGQALAYRIEVPKAACMGCQPRFSIDHFVPQTAKEKIEAILGEHNKPMPDWSRVFVIWKAARGDEWATIRAGGIERLIF
jgi:hypothetical protein